MYCLVYIREKQTQLEHRLLVSPNRFPHAAHYVITSFTAISPSTEKSLNATKRARLRLNREQNQQPS